MFCKFCGCEIAEGAAFCTGCGKELSWSENYTAQVTENPINEKFVGMFSSGKFNAATILYTVFTALSFLATALTGSFTIPILNIFIIIALFKLKEASKNEGNLDGFVSGFKTLRVITVIQRVLYWILVGVFGVVGVLMIVIGASLDEELMASFVEGFNSGMELTLPQGFEELSTLLLENVHIFLIAFGVVFVIVAIVLLVFNLTMQTTFVKCAKQFEETAKSGENVITKAASARGWLIFTAIISILGLIGAIPSNIAEVLALASSICSIIALFIFADILKADNLE